MWPMSGGSLVKLPSKPMYVVDQDFAWMYSAVKARSKVGLRYKKVGILFLCSNGRIESHFWDDLFNDEVF